MMLGFLVILIWLQRLVFLAATVAVFIFFESAE